MRFRAVAVIIGALLLLAGTASADNIHQVCLPNPCTSNGTDQSSPTNPANFELGLKGDLSGTGSGDLYLLALVPNNEAGGFNVGITGTNVEFTTPTPINIGSFSSGFLGPKGAGNTPTGPVGADGFTCGSCIAHPLSAYLTATNLPGVDPSATGYEVFLYSFGDVSLPTHLPTFNTGTMPLGTTFTAFITTDDTKTIAFDMPNSDALLIVPPVPEPRYYGILMIGMLGLAWMMRRKLEARVPAENESQSGPEA